MGLPPLTVSKLKSTLSQLPEDWILERSHVGNIMVSSLDDEGLLVLEGVVDLLEGNYDNYWLNGHEDE